MKKLTLTFALLFLAGTGIAAAADEAPPPRKMPRIPVNRQEVEHKPSIAPASSIQGAMNVIESEKLHIGDIDVRLFGVVPPQLSASFGPQARAVLDRLVAGQTVTCLIRDRDQSGRFLATCRTASTNDLALELLRRGLAVTARGSLANTDLVQPYLAAEQAAQSQKIGLWSGITPSPAAIPASVAAAATPASAVAAPQAALVPAPPPTADAKKEIQAANTNNKPTSDAAEAKLPPMSIPASVLAPAPDETSAVSAATGFFARYQILITGLIMLATALSILGVLTSQRRQEKRDELKALAAALRGELTAARGVCLTRFKSVASEADDKALAWPRLRATLYQAYVGRLGLLGADLARQVASIYGQASDYATYYTDDAKPSTTPKRQALQTLVSHIEEVLPKLAQIESSGHVSFGGQWLPVTTSKAAPLVERSITTRAAVAATEEAAAQEVAQPVTSSTHPIWDTMRKFARERFKDDKQPHATDEQDYAALIEQEMANLTFGEAEDNYDLPPAANVTKIRSSGS